MSFYGSGGQNGGSGRGGGTPQTALLTGPQLFVNSNQLQFQTGTQNFTFPQQEGSQSQLQLSTGGTPLLLQPPVNFVTDQLGLGQLITQAAVTQSQQNLQNIMNLGNVLQMTDQQSQSSGQQSKQRVFTGMVTKIHDNFGFIDEEVFFQMGVVKGPILPKEGDRVLVEADFNPSMPFKWNATRVQIVNIGGGLSGSGVSSQSQQSQQSGYQQHQQQMMGYSTSMASVQKPVPPPPTISSGRPQPVSIVSNPHSIYSSSTSGSRPGPVTSGHVSDPMSSRRQPAQIPAHMAPDNSLMSGGNLPSLLQKLDSARERERDRKDRDKDRDRLRDRSRSKERPRERDRRDRSRERRRSKSRSKSRERRARRSPTPKRRSREREQRRDRSPETRVRDRSPISISSSASKVSRPERVKRSRSRETLKTEKSKSPSPSRKIKPGAKATLRYYVDVPRFSLDTLEVNGKDLKQRYSNLYIPSDFFLAKASWIEAFPLDKPFPLGQPSLAHIFGRRVERIEIADPEGLHERFRQIPSILDAPDSSCTFSVKVMLLSTASIESIYRKLGFISDSKEESEEKGEGSFQSLQRLLCFLVGVKTGKHDITALGGPWSPSLDGPDPQSDPKVLINTAIRCVKAMASIDLTRCKYWYRFMEIYYRRSNGNLETVVYFLPDISSCIPQKVEWESITKAYKIALHGPDPVPEKEKAVSTSKSADKTDSCEFQVDDKKSSSVEKAAENHVPTEETSSGVEMGEDLGTTFAKTKDTGGVKLTSEDIVRMEVVDECNGDVEEEEVSMLLNDMSEESENKTDTNFDIYGDIVEVVPETVAEKNLVVTPQASSAIVPEVENQHRGTHFSQLDPKTLNVAKLREELSLRGLNTKGLKAQLTNRLVAALQDEQDAAAASTAESLKKSEATDNKSENLDENEEETGIVRLADPSKIFESHESTENEDTVVAELNSSMEIEEKNMEDGEIKDEDVGVDKKSGGNGNFPLIKPEMSQEEKKQWERRYSLPKTPKILVFPAIGFKSDPVTKFQYFDCSVMPLSSLRDYRVLDRREESFEVSLFSEFFYQMLQRDFAFRIYTEILKQSKNKSSSSSESKDTKDDSDKGTKEKDKEAESASKRRKTSNASVVTVDSSKDAKDKMKVVDPLLLLAFTFYDENRCGYLMDVHVEEICTALGIGLTRHELQRLLRKVALKGSLYYRKWTDKPELESVPEKLDPELVKKASRGNTTLLPVFTYNTSVVTFDDGAPSIGLSDKKDNEESVMVTIDGEVVDVMRMKSQVEAAKKDRIAAEATVNVLKNSLNEAKNNSLELKKSNDSLNDELRKTKDAFKKLETSDKSNRDDLEVFRKSTERYLDRIKDLVKLPIPTVKSATPTTTKEDKNDKTSGSSTKKKMNSIVHVPSAESKLPGDESKKKSSTNETANTESEAKKQKQK